MLIARALSLFGLVLVLASGSVTMAMARHQVRAVHQTVICTGYGLVAITIDADGNPTGPLLPCPECVPAQAAPGAAAEIPVIAAPTRVVPVRHVLCDNPATVVAPRLHRLSRAPPVAV